MNKIRKEVDFESLSTCAIKIADNHLGNCIPKRKIRKLGEEVAEFCEAIGSNDDYKACEELGDVLFVVVHLSSALKITPYQLLALALDKFEKRIIDPNYKR
jgi:NTP pyrophosphatase (non-canonical NTP hydrolase)